MNYNQPEDELKAIAERILKVNHDKLAYHLPAVDTFYFALDSQRIARAYLRSLERPKRVVIGEPLD